MNPITTAGLILTALWIIVYVISLTPKYGKK